MGGAHALVAMEETTTTYHSLQGLVDNHQRASGVADQVAGLIREDLKAYAAEDLEVVTAPGMVVPSPVRPELLHQP